MVFYYHEGVTLMSTNNDQTVVTNTIDLESSRIDGRYQNVKRFMLRYQMSLVMSSGVSDQVRLKLACSATEASLCLEISAIDSRDIILSKQQTTKALIRLRRCTGWSAPLLFAYDIRHIFSWPSSNEFTLHVFLTGSLFLPCQTLLLSIWWHKVLKKTFHNVHCKTF